MFFGSVPLLVYIAAVIMNLTGVRLEGFLLRSVEIPAMMNRGVSLLALGTLLRFRLPGSDRRIVIRSMLLRYSSGIMLGTFSLFFLPFPAEYRITIASALVMPVGMAVIPTAVRWGYNRNTAAAILNTGIPVSFILFWLVWVAGRYLTVLQP
jgi:predicted permease